MMNDIVVNSKVSYFQDPTKECVVVCDETNNTKEDKDNGIMNVDVTVPVIPYIQVKVTLENPSPSYEEFEKFLDESNKEIAKAMIVKLPDENDGGIGQGGL